MAYGRWDNRDIITECLLACALKSMFPHEDIQVFLHSATLNGKLYILDDTATQAVKDWCAGVRVPPFKATLTEFDK
jgi:hypothetical protein